MARPKKTEGKKTARIGGTRCTPEEKKQLEDLSRDEGCGGQIWPLIFKKLIGKKPYHPKPIPEEQLLLEVRRELKLLRQRRDEIKPELQMSFDYSVTTILKFITKRLDQIR